MADKEKRKLEKKRIKEESKLRKKQLKAELELKEAETGAKEPPSSDNEEPTPREKSPWYKDPSWIRTIIAIIALMVGLLTLILAL